MKSIVALVLLASPSLADPPRPAKNADAWCAEHGGDAFTVDEDGRWFRTDDPPGPDRKTFAVVWRGRLDSDRRQDVILDEGGCGTRECLHGGYVQCADRTYASVFTHYASRVRVKPQRTGWAVVLLEHVGDTNPDGSYGREWSTYRFDATGY